MARIANGIFAGFIATLVLSVFMVMKQIMGMMPELNVIQMLSGMAGTPSPLIGWLIHFFIGTIVWGGLFGLIHDHVPGTSDTERGIVFGMGAWLLMMVTVMPMAGVGIFGLRFGMSAPVMTLLLHIVFGVTLGAAYGRQTASSVIH